MAVCVKCNREIPKGSAFCNFCGNRVIDEGQSVVHAKNTKLPILSGLVLALLVIIGIGVAFLFTPLGDKLMGGPPDNLIYEDHKHLVEGSNVELIILNKSKCENLPAEVRALGVTEVWLVGIRGDGPYALTIAYANQNDSWRRILSDQCP